jgi:ABC-2 type transport system ATP-binding protein
MPEPALRFTSVTKSYGRSKVLHDLSFEIGRGAFFGLVGINGAGKTTLLKCLLDFCTFERGAIEIFGVAHDTPGARARLSFLPERLNPPYYLSGGDFIRYTLEMQALAYDRGAAEHMLQALDLDAAALARPVRTYSKGMTQKLGLAASLLSRKDLYLFDEPTSGLDPKARALFKRQLHELKKQSRTVFFTSHALADVAEVCDHMAVIHAGELRFCGTPQALCRDFASSDLEQAFLNCIGSALPESTGAPHAGTPDYQQR